ncbi:hypothetical protein E4S40_13990 [Algoriphagus kandeliae]|uniref:Plug domain-containing protein n=1 Tax=Algoriphagus kandeliae TaxID=2562278 RepID=A0A4Y9QP45_9BACT|nr:hypothetical protein [Algoriphagus kandeliae]TFV93362.1 hypothetical protein E4S40_13990 [Algoriphagus kandeliae]
MVKIFKGLLFAVFSLLILFPKLSLGQEVLAESVSYSIPKTIYFTGEKIWIQAQVLQGNSPTSSHVLYAELLNRENQSVHLAKLLLEKGEVFHFLEIPDDIPSDNYLLRVYTRISPILDLENGLQQQFVTVFNPSIPPQVRTELASVFETEVETNSSLNLSKQSLFPGERLTVSWGSLSNVSEVIVRVKNPYLNMDWLISSSEIYDGKIEGNLLPELFGHIVAAQVDPRTVDTTKVYFLSVHGRESALYTDRPDSEGNLYFDIGGLKHWDFMIAQADQNGSLLDFEFRSPAIQTNFKQGFEFPELVISTKDQPYLQELLISRGVQTFFIEKYSQEPVPVVTGFVADRTFMLDDYTRFESVETVIKEYVPMISVRTRKGLKEFRSINENGGVFSGNPLMLVDGMPVFDSDQLASFNPKNFEKLEVLSRLFYLNDREFEGVMSFSSYQSNVGGFPLPSNAFFTQTPGIQIPVELLQPITAIPEDAGDYRSILFWSADKMSEMPKTNSFTVTIPNLFVPFEVEVISKSPQGEEVRNKASFWVKKD